MNAPQNPKFKERDVVTDGRRRGMVLAVGPYSYDDGGYDYKVRFVEKIPGLKAGIQTKDEDTTEKKLRKIADGKPFDALVGP